MRKLELEKVNMKIVIGIAIGLVVILTAMFIIFKVNIILDNDKKDEPNTEESDGSSNSNNPTEGEDQTDSDNPSDPGNSSNPDEPNNNGSNSSNSEGTDEEEPNYDDPDENEVSEEAKDRTKKKEDLTLIEKEYILQDNILNDVGTGSDVKKNCGGDVFCVMPVSDCNYYQSKKDKITSCKGDVIFSYNEKTKTLEFDMSEVECE